MKKFSLNKLSNIKPIEEENFGMRNIFIENFPKNKKRFTTNLNEEASAIIVKTSRYFGDIEEILKIFSQYGKINQIFLDENAQVLKIVYDKYSSSMFALKDFREKKERNEFLDMKVEQFLESQINNLVFSNLIFSNDNLNDTGNKITHWDYYRKTSNLKYEKPNVGSIFGSKICLKLAENKYLENPKLNPYQTKNIVGNNAYLSPKNKNKKLLFWKNITYSNRFDIEYPDNKTENPENCKEKNILDKG